ncbi:MAG: LysR family transcriptional regulator [Myxococcota bacterium]
MFLGLDVCNHARVDWNDLIYVLAVSREGNLLSAAKALGVARTTASRRLSSLEAGLGVTLFDRTPDGLVATSAGQELTAVAERVEDEVLAAEARVRGRDKELRGELRLSTVDVVTYAFTEALAAFANRYPNVHLSVSTTSHRISLSRREADVALRLSNTPPEHLVGRKVGFVQFGVYAAKTLENEFRGAQLGAYPWIGWDGGEHLNWFDQWLSDNAPGARIVFRLSDRGLLMTNVVASGIGAQLLPCIVADRDPRLARIAPLDDLFRLDLWLLTLPQLRNNSRIRAFVQHMSEAISEQDALLKGVSADASDPPDITR